MKLQTLETVTGIFKHIGKSCILSRQCAIFTLATSFLIVTDTAVHAQCTPPSMSFKNPTLISGRAGRVGATYKFANVATGIDCHIQILALAGGAALGEIDNTTQGYFDAWQPYVTAGANATSYLDWKISFKKANTTTDTMLRCLAITAIDVDGDGSKLREFIVASTPGAYAVDPNTSLSVTFDGVNSTAIASYVTVPSIDTNARKAMFQMNFTNVSTIVYRNGSISSKSTTDDRHTCIYFKSFFNNGLILLPVNLLSFNARSMQDGIQLNWKVTQEENMLHYTVQRSTDGINWTNIGKVNAMNVNNATHTYVYHDKNAGTGTLHYRLQQTDTREQTTLSTVVSVNNNGGKLVINTPTLINGKSIPIQIQTTANEEYTFSLYTMQGQLVSRQQYAAQNGTVQTTQFNLSGKSATGIYMLIAQNRQGNIVYRNSLLLQ